MITVVFILVLLWIVFNLVAPYVVLLRAERIGWGRLPAELLMSAQDKKVKFYITSLKGGYGFSVWAPGMPLIVFDKGFFRGATPPLLRFVIAHEMGHFHQHHHIKRWMMVVTGLVLVPAVRRWLARMEDDADAEAARRTGFSRKLFPELGGC